MGGALPANSKVLEINDEKTWNQVLLQDGCRCDACREAQAEYARDYQDRKENAALRPYVVYTPSSQPEGPTEAGEVELAVREELESIATKSPTLAAVAVSLAKILDNPRARSTEPSAAKVLTGIMERLHRSTTDRRGNLALVKGMTTNSLST